MGGTGNTGATPEKQLGVQSSIAAGGDPAMPQWGAGAAAPGTVAGQQGLPALTEAPPSLRPYEEAAASTGTGAGPQTGLLAPTGVGGSPSTVSSPMGFQHDPYPTKAAEVPTLAAPAPPPAAPAAPAAPAQVAMRQIWQPQGGNMTAAQWLAANPNWEADFNRAEQRADGTWWVPQDPNVPRPGGPQYYQGTGNVTYGGFNQTSL